MRKTYVTNHLFPSLCSRIAALLPPETVKQFSSYEIAPEGGEFGPTRCVIETDDHITPPFVLHLDMVEAPMPEDPGGVTVLDLNEAALWLASELSDDLAELRANRAIAASDAELQSTC